MDTKKIRALLTALDTGSLTAAAEELGYTQSGLTHMMNSLEDELFQELRTVGRLGAAAGLFGLRPAFHLYRAHGSFAALTVPAAARRTGLLLLLRGLCRSRFRLDGCAPVFAAALSASAAAVVA